MNQTPSLAILGGSGFYSMPGLENPREVEIETPFGKPSAPVRLGLLEGVPIAFLARHGLGHTLSPSEINYRANIYALKSLGVERIVGISAVGSLREDFAPGEIVVPDQLFDFTKNRHRSFFGDGLVAHINVADPFCPQLSQMTRAAIEETGATVHKGGQFITIEGPHFSTRSESNTFRSWGMSIIGMTTSPEAFLAREAELCYAVMAHVTDYDVWHSSEAPVTVDMVIKTLNTNTHIAQETVRNLARNSASRECQCDQALANALITNPKMIPAATREKLDLLVKKYLS